MLDTLIPVALLASLAEAKSSTKKYIADDEPSDFDTILWPIVLCFAGGIYLVYERYQRAHNSPVPFEHHAPVQADPQLEGLPLENANLQSHLQHPDVLPPIDIPGQEYITAFDPATSLHLGTYLADDENVIAFKINKAARAQRRWHRRPIITYLDRWVACRPELVCRSLCSVETNVSHLWQIIRNVLWNMCISIWKV